mgnify:CR=1 FL=1
MIPPLPAGFFLPFGDTPYCRLSVFSTGAVKINSLLHLTKRSVFIEPYNSGSKTLQP